jgi:zinc protease
MSHRFGPPALLLLCLSPVARAGEPNLPNLPIESYRLANGLKVVLHRDATVPRVTVCVAYHVGSKDERAGRTGFAHFFEHMMFRGTKNVPNFDVPLQETGGQSNAFTNEDVTVYHETLPGSYLERALYLEAERLAFLPSALDQEKFDTEREVVKNERRETYENVPYGLAEETLLATVFPKGHPYSWSVIGSMADLNAASLKDLKRFFLEYYHPGNASLCLAGDFDPATAKALIAKYFGPLAAGKTPERAKPVPTPPRAARLTLADRVSLPRLYWAWPTVADDHPDSAPLDLLANILTDGDASRLERALVIDGRVAKDVSSSSDTKEIAGLFTIDATAAEGKELKDVEAVLIKEFERLKHEPPTQLELTRALAKFEKKTYSSLTAPLHRAYALAIGFLEKDDPAYYRRDIARYFQVTPADLKRVAETYLVADKVVLAIEPMKPGQPKGEPVTVGPPPATSREPEVADRTPAQGPDWSKLPGPAPSGEYHPPAYVRKTLSNGLEVWVVPWKTLPIVTARLIVPVGTGDDPAGKAGLAGLTATLLSKGTKDKSTVELAEELEGLGVSYSCVADNDDTTLGFNVLVRNLDPALRLLTPMFTAPRLDPADFEREREIHLSDLLQGPDEVGWIAQRAFRALLYGQDHPYGRPVDGFVESVKAITLDDVRSFHAAHFAADRSKLVIVGDVDPEALIARLEAVLGGWKTKGPAPSPRPGAKVKAERGVIYLVDKPGAVQSVLRIGRHWVDRKDPRYFATSIGNHVFGVDFLSRLNMNLREKNGFSYGAGSTFVYRRTGSVWLASTSVNAEATAPALKELLGELEAVAGPRPLTTEEIELGRDAVSRSFPESFEDPDSIASVLDSIAVFDLPADYLATYLAHVRGVPADLVRTSFAEVARDEGRVVLVVGDRRAIEPRLKALGLGEVRVVDPDGKPLAR